MKVSKLKEFLEAMDPETRVVLRQKGEKVSLVSGVHVRPYDSKKGSVVDPENQGSSTRDTELVFVLNPYDLPAGKDASLKTKKKSAIRDHSCPKCGNRAKNTIRREIFGEMRTVCERCGAWWTPGTNHPYNESSAIKQGSGKKSKPCGR